MKNNYLHTSLEESTKTLNCILDIISDGIWDWNAINGYVYRSPGWYRMLGYEVDSLEKNVFTWENVIHKEDYPHVMQHFEDYINGNTDSYHIQYRCKKRDGTYLWVEDSGKIVERTIDGKVARMIGAHTDINEAKIANEKLHKQNASLLKTNISLENLVKERTQELENINIKLEKKLSKVEHNASHDVLTKLYNRRMFEEMLSKEINRAHRYSHPLSIILLDIDDFKLFNDTYGHKVGDEILYNIANILKINIRKSDIISRWGGEEFVIILPNLAIDEAKQKAELMRETIENYVFYNSMDITCSFGVTSYVDNDTSDSIFVRVDKALYNAKGLDKNNVQVV